MPEQRKCQVCGRFMETFETESGSSVQICAAEDHSNIITFNPRPTSEPAESAPAPAPSE